MEGRDRRQQDEEQRQQQGQSGGAGDESPVLGIRATPSLEHDGAEISTAAVEPLNTEENGPEDDETEFEFAFASNLPTITAADEIFSDGRIRPVYPVFDRGLFLYYQSQAAVATEEEEQQRQISTPLRLPLRDLMMEHQQRSSTAASNSEGAKTTRSSVDGASSSYAVRLARASSFSSSDADDLDGVPAGTYCVWTPGSVPPSPEHLGRKSRSTGSTGTCRRWRLRDLVLGRSHSDGRHKLMFFQHEGGEAEAKSSTSAAAGSSRAEEEDAKSRKKDKKKSNDRKEEGKKKEGKKNSISSKDQPKASTMATNQRKKKSTAAVELDLATAHRLYYKSGGAAAAAYADSQGQRRSSTSLPYRKDLFVGIFPHARSPGRGLGFGSPQAPPSFYGF